MVVFHLVRHFHIEALKFNFETERWGKTECNLNDRLGFCSSEINKKIYLVGGCNSNDEILSSVDIVDKNFQTTKASSMNIGRTFHGMCGFDDRFLLVAGGSDDFHSHPLGHAKHTKSCEIYDSFTDKWEKTSDLIVDRVGFSLLYFNGKILAIGGCNEKREVLDTIESYDIKTKKWEIWSTKLMRGRFRNGAIAFDDKFYVFGGVFPPSYLCKTMEMYSLETGQFTYVKPIPVPIYNVCCRKDNCIYVFGRTEQPTDVQIYNTELDLWTTGISLPHEVEVLSACNL